MDIIKGRTEVHVTQEKSRLFNYRKYTEQVEMELSGIHKLCTEAVIFDV